MTRYLISFDDGAMNHIPDEEGPAVGEAAHAVVREAMDAGVFVFAGGCREELSVVDTDGTVTDSPESKPYVGWVGAFTQATRTPTNCRWRKLSMRTANST